MLATHARHLRALMQAMAQCKFEEINVGYGTTNGPSAADRLHNHMNAGAGFIFAGLANPACPSVNVMDAPCNAPTYPTYSN